MNALSPIAVTLKVLPPIFTVSVILQEVNFESDFDFVVAARVTVPFPFVDAFCHLVFIVSCRIGFSFCYGNLEGLFDASFVFAFPFDGHGRFSDILIIFIGYSIIGSLF